MPGDFDPEGRLTIAPRFIAGTVGEEYVTASRRDARKWATKRCFDRPYGT